MRRLVFAVLAAVPVVLAVWVARTGRAPRAEPEVPVASAQPEDLLRSPPAGARAKGTVQLFGPDELADYIDGGAPPYVDAGFVRLAAAELSTSAGHGFACDLYDMGTPANAESMARRERSASLASPAGWPEAAAGEGALFFPERRWYVKLTALDPEAGAFLETFGRALRGRLP